MSIKTTLHLFGSLRKSIDTRLGNPVAVNLDTPTPLSRIISDHGIPEQCVQLVMINHRAVTKDAVVHPGDRLALFPAEYPFFADWKNLRSAK